MADRLDERYEASVAAWCTLLSMGSTLSVLGLTAASLCYAKLCVNWIADNGKLQDVRASSACAKLSQGLTVWLG